MARKKAVSYNGGYDSLVHETRELILQPKWHTIGLSVHIANEVFNKTVVQFHKDMFLDYIKAGEKEPMSVGTLNGCHSAYRFRELCSPAMRDATTSKSLFEWASQDEQFKLGKITADQALKKMIKQGGGVRRLATSLSTAASAATMVEEHPELLRELNPVVVNNAIKALSRLIIALKKVSTKSRTRKAA